MPQCVLQTQIVHGFPELLKLFPEMLDVAVLVGLPGLDLLLIHFLSFSFCCRISHHVNLDGHLLFVRVLLLPCDLFWAWSPTDCKLTVLL